MFSVHDLEMASALLHSLQVCVKITMDVVAMLIRDIGLVVETDYTNIEKLTEKDMECVKEGMVGIDGLYAIVVKLIGVCEKLVGT